MNIDREIQVFPERFSFIKGNELDEEQLWYGGSNSLTIIRISNGEVVKFYPAGV